MDAGAMTRLAKDWVTVPAQKVCETPETPEKLLDEEVNIPAEEESVIPIDASSCAGIKHLEHIHLRVLNNVESLYNNSNKNYIY